MATTLEMPQLSGGRKRARALVAGVQTPLRDQKLIVDCRQLLAGTESFAQEIIRAAIVDEGAAHITFANVDADFAEYLGAAARDMHVDDLVTIQRAPGHRFEHED